MRQRSKHAEDGRTLAALRTAASLTRADLARLAGTSARYVGLIERGRRRPSSDMLRRIFTAIGNSR
jgi:transcriptional regulator with XRE-family HTH domain